MLLSGLSFADPVVYLLSPINGSNSTTNNVTFEYNATDTNYSSLTCYMFLNGVHHMTRYNVQSGVPDSFTLPGVPSGTNHWYVECENPAAKIGRSETWTVYVN